MNEKHQLLLERASTGEAAAFDELVRQLRVESPEVLLEMARSPDVAVRRVAIASAQGRREPELLEAMTALAQDPVEAVRRTLAEALENAPDWPLDAVVEKLLHDWVEEVRDAAARAARRRPALAPALAERLSQEGDWRVRQTVASALADTPARIALPALAATLGQESDRDVVEACAGSFEKHLTSLGTYPDDLERPRVAALEEAQRQLLNLGGPGRYPALMAWLDERVSRDVDLEKLRSFGTVLTLDAEADRLQRAHGVERVCEAVEAVLTGDAPRAAVLLGDPGSGKTAIIGELVHRLKHDPEGPWHVVRVTPSDLLAGTAYLGEWQTKVRNLVQAVRAPRRVILYIPNLEELSEAGRSSSSDTNIATALAPQIERGDIVILGESSREAFRTGLGAIASLRRLFHAVEVRETSPAETRRILQAVRDEAGAEVPEAVLDRLMELADFYLAGTAQPGRTVGLLRRVLGDRVGKTGPVAERDVLNTLSTSTGIPVDLLDDNVPLDRTAVRAFFEARVMGQPEALDAVVDLVTLVKAGLTDPGKPFGVLLFVGPTGVGKTELARALAEYLFGDAARLVRLDMSEFATYEAFERLIGTGGRPGTLTATVRERPFSVLLFDEIEKAHLNVYDLCLQIFDAGRLTDAQGRTADFRRTIIILTSNVGSSPARETPVGFGREAPAVPDRDATLRELSRWFRPEFLNRLDRIVTFRPLAAETAEKIAHREVARVLERSGLTRRRLDVDVDPGVFALLLREGYSPAFGARPLKRTVERLVLLPVARAIAAGNVPAGAVLRLAARGGRVEVDVTPPESPESGVQASPAPAVPTIERARLLAARVSDLRTQALPLAARKSEQVARSAEARFWDDRETARQVLDEIYRLDGIFAALDSLAEAVRNEVEPAWTRRVTERDLARLEERLDILDSQARHVAFLLSCRGSRELGDTFLTLTLVASRGKGLDAVARLARMYLGLARRRGLETEVFDDRQGGNPREDTIGLLVSGAGAFALLAGEAGLHQLTRGRERSRTGQQRAVDRDVVRVEVLPVPPGEVVFPRDEVRVEIRPLDDAPGRLLSRPRFEVQLLHLPSMTGVRAWTDRTRAQALERLQPLLHARMEAARAVPAGNHPPLVRRYTLGPAPLVRDPRTGRSTGRLDQVLEGHLDIFLMPPS